MLNTDDDILMKGLDGLSVTSINKVYDQESHLPLNRWLNNKTFDIKHRLHVAKAIAITVCDYHGGGMALQHNNNKMCTSSNIVILDIADGHQHYIARLIHDPCDGGDDGGGGGGGGGPTVAAATADKLEDLKDLGHVFCELLQENNGTIIHQNYGSREAGIVPRRVTTDEDDRMLPNPRSKKRGKQKDAVDGLPLYLSSMMSALTEGRYTDVKHVLSDLNAATRKYDIYFRHQSNAVTFNELKRGLPNHFYGRESALSILMHSFHSVMIPGGQQSMMAAVSGAGGMG